MGCNIAIDGPAGAGKSTIAKRVAKELSFIYVDTGAMYRAVALYLLRNEIDGTDAEAVADNCQSAEVSIRYENGEQVVILNGENVNQYIRTEEVGNMASKTSANPAVRAHLLNQKRCTGCRPYCSHDCRTYQALEGSRSRVRGPQ